MTGRWSQLQNSLAVLVTRGGNSTVSEAEVLAAPAALAAAHTYSPVSAGSGRLRLSTDWVSRGSSSLLLMWYFSSLVSTWYFSSLVSTWYFPSLLSESYCSVVSPAGLTIYLISQCNVSMSSIIWPMVYGK